MQTEQKNGADRMKKANEVRMQKIAQRKQQQKEDQFVHQKPSTQPLPKSYPKEILDEEAELVKKLELIQKQKGVTKKIQKKPSPKQVATQKQQQIVPDYDDDEDEQIEEEEIQQTKLVDEEEGVQTKKYDVPAFLSKWNSGCKIVSITYPSVIPPNSFIQNRKFEIKFKYRDEKGIIHGATVRFGSKDGHDFICNKDEAIKRRNQKMYGHIQNPLDPRYWRYQLCNTEDDITKAFCTYLQTNQF